MLNFTQHAATPDQVAALVIDLAPADRAQVAKMLTFDTLPSREEIEEAARSLADLAQTLCTCAGEASVMIGGAPWLMPPLERALAKVGINAYYAFSSRSSEEKQMPDGTVRKIQIFKHEGFIQA